MSLQPGIDLPGFTAISKLYQKCLAHYYDRYQRHGCASPPL